ncbi:hypothetical protein NOJ28_26825 [Neorhizobium galegae]|uniref:hypothetical protein n=1 Tax=Neorhizobium galegae TaxID=399 RepID=UPI0006282A0B|nr:hypothetical protein [Neorhizobium galegae]MCQ1769143.1 hypothetical protein [Neorhizobium galegae]MCQ1846308.1 hypothetical protein [Neorhizobium galegae]
MDGKLGCKGLVLETPILASRGRNSGPMVREIGGGSKPRQDTDISDHAFFEKDSRRLSIESPGEIQISSVRNPRAFAIGRSKKATIEPPDFIIEVRKFCSKTATA